MQLGMVGLGRMGAHLVRRLTAAGHQCVVDDTGAQAVAALVAEGATGCDSLDNLSGVLRQPRAVWGMVPAGEPTAKVVHTLTASLDADDVIIDGANSYYRDDIARASALAEQGTHYVDVGTSGGAWGLDRGYCLMIGGHAEPVQRLTSPFAAFAPGVPAAPRTPGRGAEPVEAEHGFLHCGPPGAGHFVKMVHNGIEYGLMAAYTEGFDILGNAGIGAISRQADAETAPLAHPEFYCYDLDISAIAEVWRSGSVIFSWLLDLPATALAEEPDLRDYSGRVSDSGEGRWTAIAAIEEGVPAPVLLSALTSRFSSRGLDHFASQTLSAMRRQFGGHAEKRAD